MEKLITKPKFDFLNTMGIRTWYELASPENFYDFSKRKTPQCIAISLFFGVLGLITGLGLAPADYLQGEGFRIIYVHVPAAFLSLGIYSIIFVCSIIYLIWRIKIFDIIALGSASTGAVFTFIALLTGSIWGKPMWGTWWVWDARLTSELILLFLYFGYIALRSAIKDYRLSAKIGAYFALIGMIDIPIIHFSVDWWYTLHQGASLAKFARPSIAFEMQYPLYLMLAAFLFFYLTILFIKSSTELLKRECDTDWVRHQLKNMQKMCNRKENERS